uniref:Epidermal patterning factor-like protein n=1 Tax=Kalanchoe fedtschenkoi TaxID=63787 RepID=A0A7N0TDU6_KALFE
MASTMAQHHSCRLKLAAFILLLIFCLSSGYETAGESQQQWKRPILGSKPPKCDNKCYNCNPCVAALVAPNHKVVTEGDESYYLLSWKCKCGNKYYQP